VIQRRSCGKLTIFEGNFVIELAPQGSAGFPVITLLQQGYAE
jgi:hypothetical protein